jgi:hypothetical protein
VENSGAKGTLRSVEIITDGAHGADRTVSACETPRKGGTAEGTAVC